MSTATMITERPILFSGTMVRAILSGAKTMTRRVVNLDRVKCSRDCTGNLPDKAWVDPGGTVFGQGPYLHVPCKDGAAQRVFCPYGYPPEEGYSDRLWVREAFCPDWCDHAIYKADDPTGRGAGDAGYAAEPCYKPSIHMPRRLCRIVLEITVVKCERLQTITREDVRAEGIPETFGDWGEMRFPGFESHLWDNMRWDEQWKLCWDQLNGKRASGAYAWDMNPHVWAISFRRLP